MKNQVLMLLALFAMVSMSASADQNWGGYFINTTPICVQLYLANDDGDRTETHRDQEQLPEFAYEGNMFVLAVPYELENVTIVIRDEDGTVLYYNSVSSITDYYMFVLSNDVIADMFSIELYYGDYHLYGEF